MPLEALDQRNQGIVNIGLRVAGSSIISLFQSVGTP
jgi:hypothetical protein